MGKGISSSLPLAAIAGPAHVMDVPGPGSMTSTHTGNPISCAAALASIDLIVNEGLVERARTMGERLHQRLRALQSRFPQIGCVDGKGLVAGLACVKAHTKEPDADLAFEVIRTLDGKGPSDVQPGGLRRSDGEDLAAVDHYGGSHRRKLRGAGRGIRRVRSGRQGHLGIMKPDVALIGGGMIAQDQILPSLYQLQRLGVIGGIAVCDRRQTTLEALDCERDHSPGISGPELSRHHRSRTRTSSRSCRRGASPSSRYRTTSTTRRSWPRSALVIMC